MGRLPAVMERQLDAMGRLDDALERLHDAMGRQGYTMERLWRDYRDVEARCNRLSDQNWLQSRTVMVTGGVRLPATHW